MAKSKETPASGKVRLKRLDAVGGFYEVDSMADAKRLLQVEKNSGLMNYELADGDSDSGEDTGTVEGSQE
jgi:hypothetical protein